MKKIFLKVIFILVLVYNYLPAQQETDELYTKGWRNGKYWEELNFQEKIYYITGLEDGIALADYFTGDSSIHDEFTVKGFRMSDLVKESDLFYEQRANIKIPIAFAYHYVISKIKGQPTTELDDIVVRLRKTFNK